MSRQTKIFIWVGIAFIIVNGIFIWIKIAFKLSAWVVLSSILVSVLAIIIPLVITNIPKKQKEIIEDEKPHIASDEVIEIAKNYVKNNEFLADNIKHIETNLIVPKQEGTNKISYWKLKIERYWNDDLLFLATKTDKIDFQLSKTYETDDETAEIDFDRRIANAVTNPVIMVDTTSTGLDPFTHQPRIIQRRVPLEYLKRAEEAKQAEAIAKEEGVEKSE